jgi:hypothetical protein
MSGLTSAATGFTQWSRSLIRRPHENPRAGICRKSIESFFKRSHKVIVALTVQEILDEHIAKKLV